MRSLVLKNIGRFVFLVLFVVSLIFGGRRHV